MGQQASRTYRIHPPGRLQRVLLVLRAYFQDRDGALSIDGLDVIIRALSLAVIVALICAGFGEPGATTYRSAWVVLALIVYNILVIKLLGVPFSHPPGFALFIVDWIVASTAITLTGGYFSPFIVLYYALAIGAALRLGFYRSLLLVGACALVFVILTTIAAVLPVEVKLPIMIVEITSLLMVVVTTVGMRHTVEVEAVRLAREEKEATHLRRLNEYTQSVLSASADLEVALRTVAAAVRAESGADRALTVLFNDEVKSSSGQGLRIAADGYPVPPQLSSLEERLLAEAISTRGPVLPSGDGRVACAPLVIGADVLGAVFVYFDQESDIDLLTLKHLGTQMALAIRLSKLVDLERERAVRSEESERLERDLLSVITHELRTPLTAIKTGVGALKSVHAQRGRQAENEHVEGRLILNLERSTERLITLVDELLEMARLRSRRVTIHARPVNMSELITDVVSQVQPILMECEQTIHFDLPPRDSRRWDQLWVLGDRRRLEQVLLNLLSNANKYGPHGSRITVGTTAREGNVRVFVRDEGPGVPVAEQVMIFEKFYQSKATSTGRDAGSHGLGLGLAIARAIVEIHGGAIGVSTSPSGGSTFFFSLPLHDCSQDAPPSEVAADLSKKVDVLK